MLLQNDYIPPFLLKNGHLNTIFTSQFRKSFSKNYTRKIITTPDNDFFAIDCLFQHKSEKLVILLHGLESNSGQTYMKAMAHWLFEHNYSVVCLNFRSCSGEPNHNYDSYHSGRTEDLHTLIDFFKNDYPQIDLVGFSLGGNVLLKYLGEKGTDILPIIHKAVAISVPCDFHATALHLMNEPSNYIYRTRFLHRLKQKLHQKMPLFPDKISIQEINKIKNLQDYDNYYTAPAHGFKDAIDYWNHAGSIHYVKNIVIPTLLINAQDDPFLTPSCFPIEIAKNHPYFHLQIPKYGGHVGFFQKNKENILWHEKQTIDFLLNFH